MSVNALAPKFSDRSGYLAWRATWRTVYRELSNRIRAKKLSVREIHSKCSLGDADMRDAKVAQRDLHFMRADARKMMKLLDDARDRRDRILKMHTDLAEQPFPLELTCRTVDFHFNKGSIEYPFLPYWVVKAEGKSFYVRDLISQVPFSTKNRPDSSTKGLLRFRRCSLKIDGLGVAHLT